MEAFFDALLNPPGCHIGLHALQRENNKKDKKNSGKKQHDDMHDTKAEGKHRMTKCSYISPMTQI
eukprot:1763496-Ditylum_brightwellii.AAC.1